MSNILYPDIAEFETMLEDSNIVVVDFWATWCGPCRMVAPIIEQLAQKYEDRVKFAKIDIDENSELADKYQIQSIPTVVVFKDGSEQNRCVGVRGFEEYSDIIEKTL